MRKKTLRNICLAWLMLFAITTSAQTYSIYNDSDFDPISRAIYKPGLNIHTSIKPLRLDLVNQKMSVDSLIQRNFYKPSGNLNILKRFIHDDFLSWEEKGDNPIFVRINPLFNLEIGKDRTDGKKLLVNTRAIMVEGKLGHNLAFYGDVYENQGFYASYIDDFVTKRGVLPGQGRTKEFRESGYDFSQSTGYLSYNAGPWINLHLGYGKNFIGDGYRSLLLSDNSYSYPHIKMTTTFWKVQYMVMISQFLHIDKLERGGDERFPFKYGVFHYLNWNLGNRVSFGIFENVIWADNDETGHRGLDLNYMIPIVMYRPVEYSLGSPDNVTMGANLRVIPWTDAAFYGQFVMGEFKQDEVFGRTKWWANKQGYQVGFKAYNFLNIANLDVQTEYSQIRPYTYSHYWPITNYGHFNQELAHPLGSSFRESISFLKYRFGRWYLNTEAMYAIHGKDLDDKVSYGGDIFMPSVDRPFSHGHEIGQGLRTTIMHGAASISFLINPKNNMNLSVGTRIRQSSNELEETTNTLITFSLRTSLRNIYYNF